MILPIFEFCVSILLWKLSNNKTLHGNKTVHFYHAINLKKLRRQQKSRSCYWLKLTVVNFARLTCYANVSDKWTFPSKSNQCHTGNVGGLTRVWASGLACCSSRWWSAWEWCAPASGPASAPASGADSSSWSSRACRFSSALVGPLKIKD